jgi:hypothetical protein
MRPHLKLRDQGCLIAAMRRPVAVRARVAEADAPTALWIRLVTPRLLLPAGFTCETRRAGMVDARLRAVASGLNNGTGLLHVTGRASTTALPLVVLGFERYAMAG